MTILITGGAGFIGSNLSNYFLHKGEKVIIYDNLLRNGVVNNLNWLRETHDEGNFEFIHGDVRNYQTLLKAVSRVDKIFHLAAQVAVTTSVVDPRTDFEINAMGTFNLLEAARQSGNNPTILLTSTNKVYGGMEDIVIGDDGNRYFYQDYPQGIAEDRPLDFHSPYGCSKGSADQYTRDYFRIYDLPTVVFRMSCIYGPRQFGSEDQGWVAYFLIASILGRSITIFGDGKQVRDILYVDDLLRAFDLVTQNINTTKGQVYNIGGGAVNTISIWSEFGPIIQDIVGHPVTVNFSTWRPGDQLVYISDTTKAKRDFGWQPQISKLEGIRKLGDWIKLNKGLFISK